MAEIHRLTEVTIFGGRRRFVRLHPIYDPTELDELMFHLRELGQLLDQQRRSDDADLVHRTADKLQYTQDVLSGILNRGRNRA